MHVFDILILTVSSCPTRLMPLADQLTLAVRALCINNFTSAQSSRLFARLARFLATIVASMYQA